jgi:protein TonB
VSERSSAVLRAFSDPEARWSTTLILSFGLHLACFFFVLVLPSLLPRAAAGPPVYVVDLVSVPAGARAPAPAGAPKAAPPQKKPPPEKAIPLPDRQPRKPPAKKPPEPKRTEVKPAAEAKPTPPPRKPPAEAASERTAAEAPAGVAGGPGAAGTQAGGAGGTGAGGGDAFNLYGSELFRRIEAAWQKPLRTGEAARRTMTVMVRLNLSSTGRVLSLDLVAPSGYEALDGSVLQAIRDAQPFPSFPAELGGAPRLLQFEFVLNPE